MSDVRRNDEQPAALAADLIEYLIVEVPDLDALESVVPALAELVATARIRILDLVALEKDADGAVAALEVDAVASLAALKDVDGEVGRMLSDHDIELASLASGLGRRASSWSPRIVGRSHSRSLRSAAGGEIVGGERIPPARVQTVLIDRSDDDRTGTRW